jgi:Protein of unknown function (DUF3617)
MKRSLLCGVSLASTLLAASVPAATMTPGLYETVTRTDGAAPAKPGPVARACFAAQDVSGDGKHLPVPTTNCQAVRPTVNGDKTSYDIVCTGTPAMRGRGEFIATANAYEGDIRLSVRPAPDKPEAPMHFSFAGHRVGDCPAATK